MKYTSEQLNERIAKINDMEEYSIEYDKAIPYIGDFWRNVDFNQKTYHFGITSESNYYIIDGSGDFVGFMENNKWNYYWVSRRTTEQEWQEIIRQLEDIADNPTKDKCQKLWDYIQSFGKK